MIILFSAVIPCDWLYGLNSVGGWLTVIFSPNLKATHCIFAVLYWQVFGHVVDCSCLLCYFIVTVITVYQSLSYCILWNIVCELLNSTHRFTSRWSRCHCWAKSEHDLSATFRSASCQRFEIWVSFLSRKKKESICNITKEESIQKWHLPC